MSGEPPAIPDRNPSKRGRGLAVKRGPHPRPIDLATVARCAQIGCTIEEIAAVLGFSRSDFYERMEADPEIRGKIESGHDRGKVSLRRRQHRRAMSGSDTMLIWLGKQRLGQRDRFDHEHGVTKGLEDLLRELDEIDREKGSSKEMSLLRRID